MRGGKRKGAGRPPLPAEEKAVAVTVRVRPKIAIRFSAWCAARKTSQSSTFADWVKENTKP